MPYIPTQTGFMRLEDSEKLLRAIFPNYPNLKPCYSAPTLETISQADADRSNWSCFASLLKAAAGC
jgi:hypothetical protein